MRYDRFLNCFFAIHIPSLLRSAALLAVLFLCAQSFAADYDNEELLKDPAVKALYHRARTACFTKAGLKKADSLRVIGEKRHDLVIQALAAEVREFYYGQEGTETQFYKANNELQLAMKKAGLTYQYLTAVYSSVVYDCICGHMIEAMRGAAQLQKEALYSKDKRAMFVSLRANGIVYDERGDFRSALKYYNEAIAYSKANMGGKDLVYVYSELPSLYYMSGEYEKAVDATYKIVEYANGDAEMLVDAYSKRCHSLFELDKNSEFMESYNLLQGILRQHKEFAEYQECTWATAMQLLMNSKEDEARQLIYDLKTAEDSLDVDIMIARKYGDYQKAYELLQRYHSELNGQHNQLDQDELVKMSSELGMAQLQSETDQLKARHQHTVFITVIIVALAIMILVVTVILIVYRRRVVRHREKSARERELFYRNMTHQLRTPMTVVLGMVNQMKSHLDSGHAIDMGTVDAAQRQSNNLLQLIKRLISASKDGTIDKAFTSETGDIMPSTAVTQQTGETSAFASFSEGGDHSILVAEDNDDVALLICNMLHDEGYSVTRAMDGQEAWEMMQEELPDMLLTDIAMPRMDGLQLMQHVRQDDTMSHLPIVVVSARVEDSERLAGISAGAEVYLAKPFINEELLLRVRKLLEQRELLRKRILAGVGTDAEETTEPEMSEEEKAFLQRINQLIDDNMVSGDVTADYLTERVGMSLSTLNRKMKNITSMSATIYIRRRRVYMAKHLLETTDKSLGEIETLCGFSTAGHFSRVFKAETGCTPGDYRQQSTVNNQES